jgi:hypothetical protein
MAFMFPLDKEFVFPPPPPPEEDEEPFEYNNCSGESWSGVERLGTVPKAD